MQSVTEATLAYYQTNAEKFVQDTLQVDMSDIYLRFLQQLPKGAQGILDLGCGSGRDSLFFAKNGFDVTAVDGSEALLEYAKCYHKHELITWQCIEFRQLMERRWSREFSGIWACASLLHLPIEDVAAVIQYGLDILEEQGIFYLSFKYGDVEKFKDGRFFCDMNEVRWEKIWLRLQHAECVDVWMTEDKRPQRQEKWFNILLKKQSAE